MKELSINLKMKVIKLFLNGHTYEEIAEQVGIAKGSVVNIINEFRDELLNREAFTTLTEAQILIELWRREYNHVRPHSALGYRPPAPEVRIPITLTL